MTIFNPNLRSLFVLIDNSSETYQLEPKTLLGLKKSFLNLNFDFKIISKVRCWNTFKREFSLFPQPFGFNSLDLKPTAKNEKEAKDQQNTIIQSLVSNCLNYHDISDTICDCVAFLRDYEADNLKRLSKISEPVLFILCLGECNFLCDYFEQLYNKLKIIFLNLRLNLEEESKKENTQRDGVKYFTLKNKSRVSPGKTWLANVLNIQITLLKFARDPSVLVNLCIRKISEIMDSQNDEHGIKNFRDFLNQLELFTKSNSALCFQHDFDWTNPVENPFYNLNFIRITQRFWGIEFRKKLVAKVKNPSGADIRDLMDLFDQDTSQMRTDLSTYDENGDLPSLQRIVTRVESAIFFAWKKGSKKFTEGDSVTMKRFDVFSLPVVRRIPPSFYLKKKCFEKKNCLIVNNVRNLKRRKSARSDVRSFLTMIYNDYTSYIL